MINLPKHSLLLAVVCLGVSVYAFKVDDADSQPQDLNVIELLESGRVTENNASRSIYFLDQGSYDQALAQVSDADRLSMPWLEGYLTRLVNVTAHLVPFESERFRLYVPPDQEILRDLALPALERISVVMERSFEHRPAKKIRVEIYPTLEAFSAASTLSIETLERSGAIGICKFHRLMILSPKALPLGYRWIDALSHEYVHLIVNELSYMKAELWLHEGTARYYETLFRSHPPIFLSPRQQSDLLEALDNNTLIGFERMSPSLVYLKDQQEVSLAFSQVSYSVSKLIENNGEKSFVRFLRDLRTKPFGTAFKKNFLQTPDEFEKTIHAQLAKESWSRTKGAMDDRVIFKLTDEDSFIGAALKDQIRLGDRMRQRERPEAALLQYLRALEGEPDNGVVLLKVARMQLLLNRKEDALGSLRRAVEKNPNYVTPHVLLASLVETQQAQPLIETALSINPFDPQTQQLRRLMLNPR